VIRPVKTSGSVVLAPDHVGHAGSVGCVIVLAIAHLLAARFDTTLTWGDIGAVVAGLAALVGIPLIYIQVLETRRTAQGAALLELLLRLQDEENIASRKFLYDLELTGTETDEELRLLAPKVEPILRTLDNIALLIYSKRLSPDPFTGGDWAFMIARVWSCAEAFVLARRRQEKRPELWKALERLGGESERTQGPG
jgi:hypothetical protein